MSTYLLSSLTHRDDTVSHRFAKGLLCSFLEVSEQRGCDLLRREDHILITIVHLREERRWEEDRGGRCDEQGRNTGRQKGNWHLTGDRIKGFFSHFTSHGV